MKEIQKAGRIYEELLFHLKEGMSTWVFYPSQENEYRPDVNPCLAWVLSGGIDSIVTAAVAVLRVWYELGFSSFSNGFEPQDLYRRMLRTRALALSQSSAVLFHIN